MSYNSRVYRQRNAHMHDEAQHEPFFSKKHDQNKADSKPAFFQAKLSVNKPGDSYEKEADAVASKVVNHSGQGSVVQQKEMKCIQRLSTDREDEKLSTNDARIKRDRDIQQKPMEPQKERMDDIHKKGMKEDEEMNKKMPVQKKVGDQAGASTASSQVSARIENSAGKGNALPKNTLHEMSAAFGYDFSGVNIHKDAEAVNMNNDLRSQAFTHGSDIFFNEGKYDPNSSSGKFLLAHELTHVIQQKGMENKGLQCKGESDFPFNGRVDQLPSGEFLLWNFSVGGHFLKQEHIQAIPKIVQNLKNLFKENKDAEVDIEGLASSSGSVTANDELAQLRADEVRNALVTAGVNTAKVKQTSSGSAKAFPDTTPENMAKSRGVRIVPVLNSIITGQSAGLPTLQSQNCQAQMVANMSLTGGSVLTERTGKLFILEAGDAKSNPGIEISASANLTPANCGEIEFVQNVRPFREIVYKDGSRNRFQSGSMVLDGEDPFRSQKTIPNTGALITKFALDSPSQAVDTFLTEGVVQTIEARDEFKTYILFKPKTGNRQTLQVGLWTWVGQARNNDPNFDAGFLKKDDSISRVIPKDGQGKTSTETPVFSPIAQDLKWQTIAGNQPGRTLAEIHATAVLNKKKQKI